MSVIWAKTRAPKKPITRNARFATSIAPKIAVQEFRCFIQQVRAWFEAVHH